MFCRAIGSGFCGLLLQEALRQLRVHINVHFACCHDISIYNFAIRYDTQLHDIDIVVSTHIRGGARGVCQLHVALLPSLRSYM